MGCANFGPLEVGPNTASISSCLGWLKGEIPVLPAGKGNLASQEQRDCVTWEAHTGVLGQV